MKRVPSHRYAAVFALGCALLPTLPAFAVKLQDDASPAAVLLGRARTLEQRGRLDLAKQDWAQVLVLQPDAAEALAGLVRAARAEGKNAEATRYLARLRSAHPKDPELTLLESNGTGQSATDLAEAERLTRAGDSRGALALYRRVYGVTPPPAGQSAVAYYQAEAATEDGRPQAIAGLRALADRYPTDTRYPIALGRILLRSPRTRAEGRTLLERYPTNPDAMAALQGNDKPGQGSGGVGEVAGTRAEATTAEVNQLLARDPGSRSVAKPAPGTPLTSVAGGRRPATVAESGHRASAAAQNEMATSTPPAHAPAVRPVSAQAPGHHPTFAAQEQAGFALLNQHKVAEAEQLFRAILAKDPGNPRALAGLGYVRQTAGDPKGALTLFEQAQENGDRSLALTRALVNAGFDLALQRAGTAKVQGDFSGAETRYRAALQERPNDPEALDGLASSLLQSGQADQAVPVYTHLTQVRPLDPGAWRGLVIAAASSGKLSLALATDAHIPADAKAPLLSDLSYLQALSTARSGAGMQVARVEAPLPLPRSASSRPAASEVPVPPPAPKPQPSTVPSASRSSQRAVPRSPSSKPAAPQDVVTPGTLPIPEPAGAPAVTASSRAPQTPPQITPPASAAKTATARSSASPDAIPGPGLGAGKASTPSHAAKRSTSDIRTPPTAVAASQAPPPAPVVPPPFSRQNAEVIAGERTEQGRGALARGENARAADLFHDAVAHAPETPDAWKGLIEALHAEGHNRDAVAEMARVPDSARGVLERDATFQSTLGATLLGDDRPSEALRAFARAQEVFADQKLSPPLDLVLRVATLLAARSNDGNLYRELMYLSERPDLNDVQRREVQMIWTSWAVRRARSLAAAGEQQRAVMVLNAAAEAFAGNPGVLSAVADGYAGVGLPKEAVALYKVKNLSVAPAREVETAVGAAIAAHDFKVADRWMRSGRERFPADSEMLTVAAELEQARGHQQAASELSKQAKALAPASDPGQVLTAELREAPAGSGSTAARAERLAGLLVPGESVPSPGVSGSRPFLPGVASSTTSQAHGTPVLSGLDAPTD